MKLSVVIPAHNEAGCIALTVRDLHAHLAAADVEHEILVVDDNSRDQTAAILRALQQEISTLVVVENEPPNGLGLAIARGFDHYSGDAVAVYMADGSDDPRDLLRFFEALKSQGVDCVFGTRFRRGTEVVGYPWLKYRLNRVANFVIRVVFGLRYNDVTNAFKLYRRYVIDGVRPLLSHHFNITVELPLKSIVRGYNFAVVPNNWYNRKAGHSKLKIKEMGSRYIFIVLYCLIEKWLSKGDYHRTRRGPIENGRKAGESTQEAETD